MITRTGVFRYVNADGTERRELRLPEDVFHADALASFADAPVTVGHPGAVTAENWRSHAVGHVASEVKADGPFVAAPLVVHDAGTIARIDAGELVEISCGYDVDLEMKPGVYNGERFDCIQRNMRGNHVAIGPKNWGRAGSEVALKLDETDRVSELGYPIDVSTTNDSSRADSGTSGAGTPPATESPEIATLRADNDRLRGENAALTSRVTANEANATEARIDAAVNARLALRENARRALGDGVRFDGRSDREIMIEVVQKHGPTFRGDGLSDEAVRAAYAFALTLPAPGLSAVNTAAGSATNVDADNPMEAAYQRAVDRNRNAWKGESK